MPLILGLFIMTVLKYFSDEGDDNDVDDVVMETRTMSQFVDDKKSDNATSYMQSDQAYGTQNN